MSDSVTLQQREAKWKYRVLNTTFLKKLAIMMERVQACHPTSIYSLIESHSQILAMEWLSVIHIHMHMYSGWLQPLGVWSRESTLFQTISQPWGSFLLSFQNLGWDLYTLFLNICWGPLNHLRYLISRHNETMVADDLYLESSFNCNWSLKWDCRSQCCCQKHEAIGCVMITCRNHGIGVVSTYMGVCFQNWPE